MATPLTDSINALITYANEITGAEDITLSDAIEKLCEGYGGGDIMTEIAKGDEIFYGKEIVLEDSVTTIGDAAFYAKNIAKITGYNVTTVGLRALSYGSYPFEFNFPKLEHTKSYAFSGKTFTNKAVIIHATNIESSTFEGSKNIPSIKYTKADRIGGDQIYNCSSITQIIINSTPSYIHPGAFRNAANLTDIYVPWSEGSVASAPWGAKKATIHYDTVFDENGDPII